MSAIQNTDETPEDEVDAETSWVEEHRDQLEAEADSDAPDAWVFQKILEGHEPDEEESEEDGDS